MNRTTTLFFGAIAVFLGACSDSPPTEKPFPGAAAVRTACLIVIVVRF